MNEEPRDAGSRGYEGMRGRELIAKSDCKELLSFFFLSFDNELETRDFLSNYLQNEFPPWYLRLPYVFFDENPRS